MRERKLGCFVDFELGGSRACDVDGFHRQTGCEVKPLSVREILDEEITKKLNGNKASVLTLETSIVYPPR